MSLLVEIATRADVPLESVVRVLTREPVNDAHKGRILSVLDSLGPEETRVLQRFALAAVHDAIPRAGELGGDGEHEEREAVAYEGVDHEALVAELVDDPLVLPEAVRLELGRAAEIEEAEEAEVEAAPLPARVESAPLVQLGSVLEELTDAVRDLRRETDAERRERVDDLAVLIDLISKGWEGVDRRLGRVERQLGRLESGPPRRALPPPLPAEAAAIEPPPVPGPPAPDGPTPEPAPEPEGPEGSSLRQRLPLLAALAFGLAIGALAALDLPTRFDASAVIEPPAQEDAAPQLQPPLLLPTTPSTGSVLGTTEEDGNATGPTATSPGATTPARPAPRPAPRTAPARTTAGTTTTAPARPAPATTSAGTTSARTTQPPRTTTQQQPVRPSFTPSRNWAWPPSAGADYYFVEFLRDGRVFYSARPTEPRLTLPERVRFTPGVYRWRVRPGTGAPAANRLEDPIVDSEFILPR